jgi:aspartate/methionine/tyrosine aminotransferase
MICKANHLEVSMTSISMTALRASAARLPESLISRVFNHGLGKPGLIPMWAGEGDLPTPAFIAEAASKSLLGGDTFYTSSRGLPDLRQSLARYHQRTYGRAFSPDEFVVTGGGMQAIQMAVQMIAGPGDEVIVPTPAWPNFRGALEINGAKTVALPMRFAREGWILDLDALFAAVTPRTRAIVINSPSNPTGWTATADELKAILDFTRAKGLWIIADEIYMRFAFNADGTAKKIAPSLQTIRQPGDRIVFAQTFSKNWAMTGWRIGWLQIPPEFGQVVENHVQYNTSGVAAFMQRGAIVALEDGDSFVDGQVARAVAGRRVVTEALAPFNSVRYAPPHGAFYAFFAVEGLDDSLAAAMKLIDEANIGLAPGLAFGDAGKPFLRVCFLRSADDVREAMTRMSTWLAAQR